MTKSNHGFITIKWGKKHIFVNIPYENIPYEKSRFPAGERQGVSYEENKECKVSKATYLKQEVKGTSKFPLS